MSSVFESELLYVILVISNPSRYKRRYELYLETIAYLANNSKLAIYTVELAFGDRPFVVTEANNPHHVQIRTRDELWHKENMINIGRAALPACAKYICWYDADIRFIRPDWAEETIHQLQHYPVVQMFNTAIMLGVDNAPAPGGSCVGFAYAHQRSQESFDPNVPNVPIEFRAYGKTGYKTGFAWAYTRECFDAIGGMMDTCIIGSADYHMAAAFINRAEETIPDCSSVAYRQMILNWQANAYPIVRGRIGYVNGLAVHYWHGAMKDRRYGERWKIVENFDPDKHLTRDWSQRGLLQISPLGEKTNLRRHMSEYFALRNEDSIG